MADSFQVMMANASKQSNKENQAGPAAGKKGAAKKPKDPTKSLARFPTPATIRKGIEMIDEDEITNSDPKVAKKFGKDHVKNVYSMVDADWHDGYDEQAEAVSDYFMGFEKFAVASFYLAVANGMAFERCHEVMRALADSWENMKSIPARCGVEDAFDEERDETAIKIKMDDQTEIVKFVSPADFFTGFWPLLLWAAASSSEIDDELVYRWMKDAHEYGADLLRGNKVWDLVRAKEEVKQAGVVVQEAKRGLQAEYAGADLEKGHKRLVELHGNKSKWTNLESRKSTHKRKRVMDRRFAGPKNRRTRNFDNNDECVIS